MPMRAATWNVGVGLAASSAVVAVLTVRRRWRRRAALATSEPTAVISPAEDASMHAAVVGTAVLSVMVVLRSPSAHVAATHALTTLMSASRALGETIKSLQHYIRSDVILGALLLSGARTLLFAVRSTGQLVVHRVRNLAYTHVVLEPNEIACLSTWLRKQHVTGSAVQHAVVEDASQFELGLGDHHALNSQQLTQLIQQRQQHASQAAQTSALRAQAGLPQEARGTDRHAVGARVPKVRFSPTAAASGLGHGSGLAITISLPEDGSTYDVWLWSGPWNAPPRLEYTAFAQDGLVEMLLIGLGLGGGVGGGGGRLGHTPHGGPHGAASYGTSLVTDSNGTQYTCGPLTPPITDPNTGHPLWVPPGNTSGGGGVSSSSAAAGGGGAAGAEGLHFDAIICRGRDLRGVERLLLMAHGACAISQTRQIQLWRPMIESSAGAAHLATLNGNGLLGKAQQLQQLASLGGQWEGTPLTKVARSIGSVVLPNLQSEALLADARRFLHRRQWYSHCPRAPRRPFSDATRSPTPIPTPLTHHKHLPYMAGMPTVVSHGDVATYCTEYPVAVRPPLSGRSLASWMQRSSGSRSPHRACPTLPSPLYLPPRRRAIPRISIPPQSCRSNPYHNPSPPSPSHPPITVPSTHLHVQTCR